MTKEVKFATETTKPENVEDILEAVGGFGRFQVFILTLLLSLEIPTALLVFVPIFIGQTPDEWLCDGEIVSKSSMCSCTGNLSAVDPHSSIVAEWNLICESSWVSDTITSLQMLGMIFGNLSVSQVSDWYGRKYSFMGISLIMVLACVVTAIAPNPYIFAAARFFCGAGFSGFLSLNAVYSIEFLTPRWRPISAAVGPFGEGVMLLGLLAYYIRPWRSLMWATIIPFASLLIIFPLVPESPRWLMRNLRIEEAHKVFSHMSKMNGKEPLDIEIIRNVAEKDQVGQNESNGETVERFSFLEFFRDPSLRRVSLLLGGIWFSWGLVYFGIGYNIKNLPGNIYINVALSGLMDSLGYPSSLLISNRLGRRKTLVIFMTLAATFLSAIAVMALANIEMSVTLLAALCFLGRYGTAGARSAVRTLSGESFPTALRVMGLGLTGSLAGIGGALAPQLAYVGSKWPSVPFFSFAILSIGGSLISFALKEMSGQPLQEQVADAKMPPHTVLMPRKFKSSVFEPTPIGTGIEPVVKDEGSKRQDSQCQA